MLEFFHRSIQLFDTFTQEHLATVFDYLFFPQSECVWYKGINDFLDFLSAVEIVAESLGFNRYTDLIA